MNDPPSWYRKRLARLVREDAKLAGRSGCPDTARALAAFADRLELPEGNAVTRLRARKARDMRRYRARKRAA